MIFAELEIVKKNRCGAVSRGTKWGNGWKNGGGKSEGDMLLCNGKGGKNEKVGAVVRAERGEGESAWRRTVLAEGGICRSEDSFCEKFKKNRKKMKKGVKTVYKRKKY